MCVCKGETKRERVKEDERFRVCVNDGLGNKVCEHVYVYVSMHAHETTAV